FDQRETMKTESGEYVALEPKDLVISKGKIYTSFPAAAFVTSSLWVLDPSPNFESTRVPVVIVEPLEPRTFTVNELKRKQELESKTDAAGTSADKD
ncbi:MAG: hypothetical protein J6X44_12645, partial [Thermoguttaceae bacterium]|nr:hypothetical protein [Thermoguttaceae bacterium]